MKALPAASPVRPWRLPPQTLTALLSTHEGSHEALRWCLQELTPAPGYVAALAAEGHGWALACWQWLDPRQQSL